jgi:hypothetical protein
MAFQTSPGVNISEIDLTNVVPAVSTTEGAIAGVFRWGPENQRILVSSEKDLVARFGEPANYYTNVGLTASWTNHETWFTAANFLAYSDALFVTRVTDATAAAATGTNFNAKYKGLLGNAISVSHCITGNFAPTTRAFTLTIAPFATTGVSAGHTASTGATAFAGIGDSVVLTDGTVLEITAIASAVSNGEAGAAERWS